MSEEWNIKYRKRITASWVGAIAKMMKTTKQAKKVQELLYSTFKGSKAIHYGMKMAVDATGLFCLNWQSTASPDGMVRCPNHASEGLVEFKNPHSMQHRTLAEACKSSTFCLEQREEDHQPVTYRLKW